MKSLLRQDYRKIINLHDKETSKIVVIAGFFIVFLLAVLARKSLISFQNPDYRIFSNWYDFAKLHGLHTFKYGYSDGFSNYNPTYNYFLYIATLLPLSKIVAIKGLLAFFDVVMAGSVYYVVNKFYPKGFTAPAAALLTLFLPTVLVTGVMWGQFDDFYVAFCLFSLGALLRGRSRLAWAFFGIAISIKLQAIFFLPVLAVASFKKIYWQDALFGVGAFLLLTLPPVLAGRSIGSLLSIYPDQAKLFTGQLSLSAPNFYQWLPGSAFNTFNGMGVYFAGAITILLILAAALWKKFGDKQLVLLSVLMLVLLPSILPAMHERYFFPATVAAILPVFILRRARYAWVAIALQVLVMLSYCPFLFNTTPVSVGILAIGMIAVAVALVVEWWLSEPEHAN